MDRKAVILVAVPSSLAGLDAPLPDDAPLKDVGKRAARIAEDGSRLFQSSWTLGAATSGPPNRA